DALQPHAGIHAGRRQRMQLAVGGAIELHEDVVPDLDVAVAVLLRAAGRTTPDVLAMVKEDLGTRAAGTGSTHGPEVVRGIGRTAIVADAHHALGGHADLLRPDVIGLVIGVIDGDPELVLRQPQPVGGGKELPGVVNGVA